jgi:iron complex outermembrane recepter protein
MGHVKAVLVGATGTVFCTLLLLSTAFARADAPAPQPFDIRPQSLAAALTEFARQSREEILFSPDVVAQKLSSGVRGKMPALAALKVLLKDSGLSFSSTPNGAILVGVSGSATPPAATNNDVGSSEKEGKRDSSSGFRVAQVDTGENPGAATVEAARQSALDNGREGSLDEIVVTAQKRAQRLQDVPQSVSAVTADVIERLGARDFHDLLLTIPGVGYSGVEPGQSRYSIRGVSTSAASPTVGIYLNDISLVTVSTGSASGAADPVLLDMDRVEVLKGPQGTLYGGSAMGGAIKYVSKEPILGQFSITTEAGGADTDSGGLSYDTSLIANLPVITDQLSLRLAASYRLDAGYVDYVPHGQVQSWAYSATPPTAAYQPLTFPSLSTFSRSDANQRSTLAIRISAKYEPDPSFTILPTASLQRSDKANPDDFFTNLPRFQASFNFNQPTRDDLDIYGLNVTKSFAGFALTSLTGYFKRTVEWDRDYTFFTGGLVPAIASDLSYDTTNTTTTTFSQEVRLASGDPAAALKWTTGIYYSHQQDELIQNVDTLNAGQVFGTGTDITYFGDQLTVTTQKSVFGDLTYTFARQWDVSLGLRWFDIKQTIGGVFDGVFNGGHSVIDDKRSTDVGFTPKAGLTYRLLDDHMLYASASKGFRQGGPNRFNTSSPLCEPDFQRLGITRAPATFGPDSLWTYEVGSKNEFRSAHLVVNGSLYYTDWKKIQQNVNLVSCGFNFTGNLGAATIKGAELSVESAVGGGVTLGVNGSYSGTRITESAPGVSAQVGEPVLDTPKWMSNLYADYELRHTAAWTAALRADYQFHGANLRAFESQSPITYPDGSTGQIPNETQIQQAYHVVNTSLRVTTGSWQYQLYCDNLTNAQPFLDFNRGTSAGLSTATTLRPRTVGISLKSSF